MPRGGPVPLPSISWKVRRDSESDSEEEEEDDDEDEDDEDDEEEDDEVPVPSTGEAMAYFAMVKRYLTSFPIDDRVQATSSTWNMIWFT